MQSCPGATSRAVTLDGVMARDAPLALEKVEIAVIIERKRSR